MRSCQHEMSFRVDDVVRCDQKLSPYPRTWEVLTVQLLVIGSQLPKNGDTQLVQIDSTSTYITQDMGGQSLHGDRKCKPLCHEKTTQYRPDSPFADFFRYIIDQLEGRNVPQKKETDLSTGLLHIRIVVHAPLTGDIVFPHP